MESPTIDNPDDGAGSITVRYQMEVADVLATRRLCWPKSYWFDWAAIVVFVVTGVIAELTGADPAIWVGFYLLAAFCVLRLFVLIPRAIAKSHRNVIRQDGCRASRSRRCP
jgi:hypothetical protein